MGLKIFYIFVFFLSLTAYNFTQSPANPPRFLTLPFSDPAIKMQQGWVYENGKIHAPKGAFDYIKGAIDNSSSWQNFNVVAASDGVAVWDDDPKSGYGNLVIIRHDQTDGQGRNYFSLYAHLKDNTVNPNIPKLGRFNTQYQNWQRVRAGEVLGMSGSTGKQGCKDPLNCIHLHFEVRIGGYLGMPIDPYDISRAGNTLYKRDKYPGGVNFSGCGTQFLWTTCPPTTTGQNNVITQATLNGLPWASSGVGQINYSVVGPNGIINGNSVPVETSNLPPGQYTITYQNGGPPNSILNGITPSTTQTLNSGGTITFTFNFSAPTLFYTANSPNVSFQEPVVDTQGNIIFISNYSGSGIRLNSISPNGTLNWQIPNNGTFISPQSGGSLVLGLNNTIYVPAIDYQTQPHLFAYASNGSHLWNASIATGNWQFPKTSPVVVNFNTGIVYASAGFPQAFGDSPYRIVAFDSNGSERWHKDYPNHARNSAAGNLVQGPLGDIYTFLFTNTTVLFTRLDKFTGNTVCEIPTFIGSDRVGGDEQGIFTDDGRTEIDIFGGGCITNPIYRNTERSLEFRKYYQGVVIAIDYPINNPDQNQVRLIGVGSSGQFLWRNPDIIPILTGQPVRVIKHNIIYVLGLDRTDSNKPKLFLIDLLNGSTISKFDTSNLCDTNCGVAVSDDKRIYISFADKIYRLL